MRNDQVECSIHSIDVEPPCLDVPGVQFHRGDARNLGATQSAEFMTSLARPLLVIEDSDHVTATTEAALHFFDPWLLAGEYIVVEDGIIDDLLSAEDAARYDGGPLRGIEGFLRQRDTSCIVDREYCDYFGRNVTWNVNGFLRKIV